MEAILRRTGAARERFATKRGGLSDELPPAATASWFSRRVSSNIGNPIAEVSDEHYSRIDSRPERIGRAGGRRAAHRAESGQRPRACTGDAGDDQPDRGRGPGRGGTLAAAGAAEPGHASR